MAEDESVGDSGSSSSSTPGVKLMDVYKASIGHEVLVDYATIDGRSVARGKLLVVDDEKIVVSGSKMWIISESQILNLVVSGNGNGKKGGATA